MTPLRSWLLILLCVLLPLRGAVAAAMLCPPADSGAHHAPVAVPVHALGEQAHGDDGPAHAHAHAHADAQPGAQAVADPAAHDHADAASVQDRCKMCAASCSLTPTPPGHAIGVPPAEVAAVPRPVTSAQPPGFVPGGFERPPRSI